MYTPQQHTFAVCAYKESPFLEACVRSLEAQRVSSGIIICTSTPNDHIADVARRHGLPVRVNRGPAGISGDWTFAYAQAPTPLVTLAHQDDVYEPGYLEAMLGAAGRARRPLICFSDYFELRDGQKVFADRNRNLRIKRAMLAPLRLAALQRSRWARRRVISMGNPICCPAVTYVKPNLPEDLFVSQFKSNLDWLAWERLSRLEGSFCYVSQPLMGHRIHGESTTSKVIGNDYGRTLEDLEMLQRFWPRPVARLINRVYAKGQDSNET